MRTRTDRIYEGIMTRGWYPARWAHHPQPIKDAIRFLRYRPQVKGCWANCQKLLLGNWTHGLGLDLEYHEGYAQAVIPIAHAWLTYRGELLELTLDPGDAAHLDSHTYTPMEVLQAVAASRCYGPVDWRTLEALSPWTRLADSLAARTIAEPQK